MTAYFTAKTELSTDDDDDCEDFLHDSQADDNDDNGSDCDNDTLMNCKAE